MHSNLKLISAAKNKDNEGTTPPEPLKATNFEFPKADYVKPTSDWAVYFDVIIPKLQEKPTKIRFAPQDSLKQTFLTISRDEYSKEEFQQCFYTDDEWGKMEKEQDETILQLERIKKHQDHHRHHKHRHRGHEHGKKVDSYRGLEDQTRRREHRRKEHRNKCVDAVMAEQDRQSNIRVFDWEGFAMVSKRASRDSVKMALKHAKRDELHACKIHRGERLSNVSKDIRVEQKSKVVKKGWRYLFSSRSKKKHQPKKSTEAMILLTNKRDPNFGATKSLILKSRGKKELRKRSLSQRNKKKRKDKRMMSADVYKTAHPKEQQELEASEATLSLYDDHSISSC